MSSLGQRLAEVESKIQAAADKAARDRSEIELIVVTKKNPTSLCVELLDLGVRSFGENRDQDARPKAEELSTLVDQKSLNYVWHFIGQLQSNKVKSALTYASVVHSLDRESLLEAMVKAVDDRPAPLDVFIQLNLTDDPGRGGIEPKNLEAFANLVLNQPNLNLLGVMGVAALDRAPEEDFATIQKASEALKNLNPASKFISAGMSEDFEAAISFGATHLRVGSAITSNRPE